MMIEAAMHQLELALFTSYRPDLAPATANPLRR
jgi:hypothetical protein